MKKIIRFAFCLGLFFLIFSISNQKVDAYAVNRVEEIGIGVTTKKVNAIKKVYINEDIKNILTESNVQVITEKKPEYWFGNPNFGIFSKGVYYYYANEFIDEVVSIITYKNDIDTLIYVLELLDDYAVEYKNNNFFCVYSHNDLVIGYIRAMKKNYNSVYWVGLAGPNPDSGFVEFVNSKQIYGLTIWEYFSHFITVDESIYADKIKETYGDDITNTWKKYDLIDPNEGSKIDLIHMFASIDCIYNKTGDTVVSLGRNNNNRDLGGWLGDLHSLTFQIYKYSNRELLFSKPYVAQYDNNFDFNNYVGLTNGSFSRDDLIADIDALNITTLFIDNDTTNISSAVSGYYDFIKKYTNRYLTFIKTISTELECPDSGDIVTNFKNEVAFCMNLKIENGNYLNCDNYDPMAYVGFKMHQLFYREA